MNHYLTTGAHLDGDLHNLMRGLALTAQAIPPGAYRDGYEAALGVVAAALGVDVAPVPAPTLAVQAPCGCGHSSYQMPIIDVMPRQRDDYESPRRGPIEVNVYEGIENVVWAAQAFEMGR